MNPIEEKHRYREMIEKCIRKLDASFELLHVKRRIFQNSDKETYRSLTDNLNEIEATLKNLYELADKLHADFSSAVSNFHGHRRLPHKEFYLLVAERILEWTDRNGFSEFQRFDLLAYEDDKLYSYINPNKEPNSGNWGIAPEDVETKYLRPEQKEYFAKYSPTTYEKFKK